MASDQSIVVEINTMAEIPAAVIGVDVGATKIASALVSKDGQVLATKLTETRADLGSDYVLDEIASQINSLAAESPWRVSGVGIGTPGQVNSITGVVQNAINLGWKSLSLKSEVSRRLASRLPVVIQKDANASVLGEYYYGSAVGCDDCIFLGIGSGLGTGIITGGQLVTGAHWSAADLGHWSLDPEGRLCTCGQRGCAETVLSGPGLIALTARLQSEGLYPTRLPTDRLTTTEILAAARDQDQLAQQALRQMGTHLGIVIAACVSLLDPARIIIGGGLGLAAYEFLVGPAREALEWRVLPENRQDLRIEPSTQASTAVGAACLVWYDQAYRREVRSDVLKDVRE